MRWHGIRGGVVAMLLLVAACGGGNDNDKRSQATGGGATNNGGDGATQVPTGLLVTVTPTAVVLPPGQSQQFMAVVSGAADTTVTWAVHEGQAGGTISSTGLYSAPATPGVFTVVAVSNENPGASASARVTVTESPLRGTFSTFLGGSSLDGVRDIAVDAVGNVVFGGATASPDFPATPGAYATVATGGYVGKLSADGKALVFAAMFPSLVDNIDVGPDGSIYLTGVATGDVPVTNGAFDTTADGGLDCYVAKLSADGTKLIYATYLGGRSNELGCDIAVDAEGNAYVSGETLSDDFPVTVGAFDAALGGHEDGFVAKLNAAGSALIYATYLGGDTSGIEELLFGIAVDPSGNAVVAGVSGASDFPTTPGAYDETPHGTGGDVVIAKLNATGSALVFSTVVGGGQADVARAVALDPSGYVYVTGYTASDDFPATGAYKIKGVNNDAFALKLRPDGSGLAYATYLPGGGEEMGTAIAADEAGNAYVAGEVRLPQGAIREPNFPVTSGALDTTFNGLTEPLGLDGFLVKLNAAGSSVIFGTYLGGGDFDVANAVAADSIGNAYVAGRTNSADFPVTPGAYDTTFAGGGFVIEGADADILTRLSSGDAFITKLSKVGNF